MITLSEPIVTSSPIATPSWTRTCARRSQERPTIAAVVAEERGPLERVEVVEVDALPHPDVPANPDAGDVEAHALFERIEVRLAVLVEVADVLPVAVHDEAVHRPSHLEQQREELFGEVVRAVLRDVPQDLRLEHVDAGVDRVAEHLPPRRLLEKALDPPVLVRHDDPELERVLDRLEADRRGRALLLVKLDDLRQVDVAERVARDDEERVVETPGGEPDGARRAERRLLDRVREIYAERLAASEVRADRLREECHGHDHVFEAVQPQELDDVLHARLADDRHHRLRLIRGQRTKARALAARHDDGLHRFSSFHASRT